MQTGVFRVYCVTMKDELNNALKRYFRFEAFPDNQEEIVRHVLEGRDLCVIMPTGADGQSRNSPGVFP